MRAFSGRLWSGSRRTYLDL
jgi:DNA-binding transcriptional LysR family regulator